MHFKRGLIALVATMFVTVGCVPQNVPFQPAEFAPPQQLSEPALPLKLASVEVPAWNPQVFQHPDWVPWFQMSGPDFAGLLEDRLRQAGTFSETASESAQLRGELMAWRDLSPTAFPPSTYEVDYKYTLTGPDGDVLFEDVITTQATDSTFYGATRMQLTMQYSHYANIDSLIDRLSTEAGPAYAELQRNSAERKAALARISAEMTPADDYVTVKADGAALREFPNTESDELGTAALHGTYHVIGKMADGWMLVEQDGETQGWIYDGSVEQLSETQIAQMRADAVERRANNASSIEMAADFSSEVITVANTEILSGPTTRGAIYGSLPQGSTVTVLATTDNGFAYVRRNGAAVGWIDRRVLAR